MWVSYFIEIIKYEVPSALAVAVISVLLFIWLVLNILIGFFKIEWKKPILKPIKANILTYIYKIKKAFNFSENNLTYLLKNKKLYSYWLFLIL